MKNVLVITIGNSDIQINKYPGHGFVIEDLILKKESCGEIKLRPNRNYNDYYLLLSSRNDGFVISKSYDQYKEILEFPLIEPLLTYFKKENKSFQEVWWVYTDQQKEVDHFQSGDTLYYKQIIQKYFESNYQGVFYKDYPITENVKDIDAQYIDFYSKALALINNTEPISNIFLLPQGGIDQINQALTLQLIQLFKDKVHVFQCAEKSEVVELMFPHLFLKDLTKKTRIKHLLDYDFDKAGAISMSEDDDWIVRLCKYATLRLNMKALEAFQLYNNISKKEQEGLGEDLLQQIKREWNILSINEINRILLSDLIIHCKILFHQKKYNELLIKLFTVNENFFKIQFETSLSIKEDTLKEYYNPKLRDKDVNENWNYFLNSLHPSLLSYLIENKIQLNNPNRKGYWFIYKFFMGEGIIENDIPINELEKFNYIFDNLAGLRNRVAHNLSGISEKEIRSNFLTKNVSVHHIFRILETMSGISDFGIFRPMQQKILAHYGQ